MQIVKQIDGWLIFWRLLLDPSLSCEKTLGLDQECELSGVQTGCLFEDPPHLLTLILQSASQEVVISGISWSWRWQRGGGFSARM